MTIRSRKVHEPDAPTERELKKRAHPSEAIKVRVESARAFGEARGWGKVKSDKYVAGVGVVLTFENGSQVTVTMPPGASQ